MIDKTTRINPEPKQDKEESFNDADQKIYQVTLVNKRTLTSSIFGKNERKQPRDFVFLKQIVDEFQKKTLSEPEEIHKFSAMDLNQNHLQLVSFGTKDQDSYNEKLYYINGSRLCVIDYWKMKKDETHILDHDEKITERQKKEYKDCNVIYDCQEPIICFYVFKDAKHILVSIRSKKEDSTLKLLTQSDDGTYTDQIADIQNTKILGHVTEMVFAERTDSTMSQHIYLIDDIRHNIYMNNKIEQKHRLVDLQVITSSSGITFEYKNHYEHDHEIHDFQFDNSKTHTGSLNDSIYFSDMNGNIIRLRADSLRVDSEIRKDRSKQTLGYLGLDDEYVYFSELGKNSFLLIDKDTKQIRKIEVAQMPHRLASINEFLILTDLNNLYIIEKETYQTIANYKIKGEVQSICQRGKDDHFFGVTNQGQIFEVNLQLQDVGMRLFSRNKEIICMSSSHRFHMDFGQIFDIMSHQKQDQIERDSLRQKIHVLDKQFMLYKLRYSAKIGQYTIENKYDLKKLEGHGSIYQVKMKNYKQKVFFSVQNKIHMFDPTNNQTDQLYEDPNKDVFIKQFKVSSKMIGNVEKNYMVFHTSQDRLYWVDVEKKEENPVSITGVDEGDIIGDIQTIDFITIKSTKYVVVACQNQQKKNESILFLLSFPTLQFQNPQNKEESFFAKCPKIISSLKVSDDQQYLAVGCQDGHLLLYKIKYPDQLHEIHEIYQPHCFQITDMLFIKRPRYIYNTKDDDKSDSDSADDKKSDPGTSLFEFGEEDDDDDYETKDQLIASVGLDRRLVITSIKQRIRLYEYDLKQYPMDIIQHAPSNKLFVLTYSKQIFELDMNTKLMKRDQKKHHSSMVHSVNDLAEYDKKDEQKQQMSVFLSTEFQNNIIRQFLHSQNRDQLAACLNYIRETSLIFRKINMATLAAIYGNYDALEVAFEQGQSIMNTLDGTSMIDLTNKAKVFMPSIYRQILREDGFLIDSQDDDYFQVILNFDIQEVKEVLNSLICDSKFSFRGSSTDRGSIIMEKSCLDYIPFIKRSQIKERIILTDQRLISQNDFNTCIRTKENQNMNNDGPGDKEGSKAQHNDREIVIFKTLGVPLFLERGNDKFLKLLSQMQNMPLNNMEQLPIQKINEFLKKRDLNMIMMMYLPLYLLMTVFQTLYMLNSSHKFDDFDNKWNLTYRWISGILACLIIFLKVLEVINSWRFWTFTASQLFFLLADFILGISTFIFMFINKDVYVTRFQMNEDSFWMQTCLVSMVFSCWIKFIEQLKFFKETRTISLYFFYVTLKVMPYVIILIVIVIFFSLFEFINMPTTVRESAKVQMFFQTVLNQYRLIFGENPSIDETSMTQRFLYILFTYVINIVNMNLMISIITIHLDAFQVNQVAQDQMSQFKMYLSFNSVINQFYRMWYRCKGCKNHNEYFQKTPKYLHFMSNDIDETEVEDDENQQDDQYMGKVKVLLKRQDLILNRLHQLSHSIVNSEGSIKQQLKKLLQYLNDEEKMKGNYTNN